MRPGRGRRGRGRPCVRPADRAVGRGRAGVGAPAVPGRLVPPSAAMSLVPLSGPVMASAAAVAYGGIQEADPFGSWIAREVLTVAHESSDHEQAEGRDIGGATLEQLRADVIRL